MPVKKKYKKLSNAEKKMNKEIRKELRAEGIIPPRKKPLNRRKFAKDVDAEYKEYNLEFGDIWFGIGSLRATGLTNRKISDEEIGVIKAIKIAIDYRKYINKIKTNDNNAQVTCGMLFENVIKPILDL